MKIKICGITRIEDALEAIEAGAHMLGYNFYPGSPRHLTRTACEAIQSGLTRRGAQVISIGVFVNHPIEEVLAVMDACGLNGAQLSGNEPVSELVELGERAFKGIRPRSRAQTLQVLARFPARNKPPAFLLDAYQPGYYGGTGKLVDWQLAGALAGKFPILLAGGLRPENVVAAIQQVRPWGVDVASGVETSPGVKDKEKMKAFVHMATQAAESQGREPYKHDLD